MRISQEVLIFTFSGDIANDTLLANIIIFALPLNGAITISHSLLCPDISTLSFLCKYLVVYLSRRSQQALLYKQVFGLLQLVKGLFRENIARKKNAQVLTFY